MTPHVRTRKDVGPMDQMGQESARRLAAMSNDEIAEFQAEVAQLLSPESIAFLRNRGKEVRGPTTATVAAATATKSSSSSSAGAAGIGGSAGGRADDEDLPPLEANGSLAGGSGGGDSNGDGSDGGCGAASDVAGSNDEGKFVPPAEWISLGMGEKEDEKLEWMGELPSVSEGRKTEQRKFRGLQARFDFEGVALDPDEEVRHCPTRV